MGCTMSLSFLTQRTKAWKAKYVKSLISLAGPWGGSAKSLEVFTVGTEFKDRFPNVPVSRVFANAYKDAIRDVERTNPSLAWMMPTSQIWSQDTLVKIKEGKLEKVYTTANIGDFFKLLDVPNMATFYEDVQGLTAAAS